MTIHGKVPTSSPISTENDGSPRLFLKYNYRTKFPWKNNHNTDQCLPANDQKMVCHTLVFIQQIILIYWFKDLFWYKKCLTAIETSIISRLDIALAAPKKQSFDFLDERGKRSTNDKQLTTRSVRHCSRREDDIVTYSAQYSILGSKIWLVHWKTPALDRVIRF